MTFEEMTELTTKYLEAGLTTKMMEPVETFVEAIKKSRSLISLNPGELPFTDWRVPRGSVVFMDEEPASDESRPTLADRLDKAEAERDAARVKLRLMETQRNLDMSRWGELLKERNEALWRAEKAESMAKRLDFVMADLEKCRRDMGNQRFDMVVGPKSQG